MEATIRVGDVEIIALRDSVLELRLEDQFPDTKPESFAPFRERYPGMLTDRHWLTPVRGFLIRQRSGAILFDAGIGTLTSVRDAFHVSGALSEELRAVGLGPEAIGTVVLSHLHIDHAGGATREDRGAIVPVFPRARYLLHAADLALATEWSARSRAYADTVLALARDGRLDDARDGQQLDDVAVLIHTPGHTPGSMSLLVRSRGEGALLAADAIPNPMLVTEPAWRYRSDSDTALATRTRIALMDRIEREGLVAMPTHMPDPFGGFVRVAGKRYWSALPKPR